MVRVDVQIKGRWKTIRPWRWKYLRGPVEAVNVQGVVFSGEAWYALGYEKDYGSVAIQTPSTAWRFYPLSPDPEFGGRINTLQERLEPFRGDLRARKQGSISVQGDISAVLIPRGWREFTEGLSRAEKREVRV